MTWSGELYKLCDVCNRGALGLPEVSLRGMGSGGSASSLGLPSGSAAPAARGLTFATINAETLETAAKDADFPVPSEAIIDKVFPETQQHLSVACNHCTLWYCLATISCAALFT